MKNQEEHSRVESRVFAIQIAGFGSNRHLSFTSCRSYGDGIPMIFTNHYRYSRYSLL